METVHQLCACGHPRFRHLPRATIFDGCCGGEVGFGPSSCPCLAFKELAPKAAPEWLSCQNCEAEASTLVERCIGQRTKTGVYVCIPCAREYDRYYIRSQADETQHAIIDQLTKVVQLLERPAPQDPKTSPWRCPVCGELLSSVKVRRCVNGHEFSRGGLNA